MPRSIAAETYLADPLLIMSGSLAAPRSGRSIGGDQTTMRTYKHILTERRGVAGIVTLNHPERLNSTTPNMRRELWEATEEFVADDAVRAIVYTGAGRAFCAGADIKSV